VQFYKKEFNLDPFNDVCEFYLTYCFNLVLELMFAAHWRGSAQEHGAVFEHEIAGAAY